MKTCTAFTMLLTLLGIASLFAPFLRAAQVPASQAKAGSLLISGVVRRAGTGEPVAEAKIVLIRGMGDDARTARTDGAGRFTFPNLPAGSYTIHADRIGYVEQSVACCDETQPGRGIGNVIIDLVPTGVVSGVVVERGGNRLPLIPVQLRKKASPSDALPAKVVAKTETNDRGEYRFHDVAPGAYYISAGMAPEPEAGFGNSVNFNGIPPDSRDVYLRQFHPGEIDPGDALPITVSPGREVPNIDFALNRQPLVRVRGTLVESQTGKPPAAASVYLKPLGAPGGVDKVLRGVPSDLLSPDYVPVRLLGDSYNASTGIFDLRRVFPGAYAVFATGLGESGSRNSPNFGGYVSATIAMLSVGEADLDDVALSLAPMGSLVVRVTVEGREGEPPSNSIVLTPVFDDVAGDIPTLPSVTLGTNLQPDGNFRIDLLPISYRLSIGIPLLRRYYIKEARFGGTDALKHPITISGLESGPLEIILGVRTRQ